LILSAAAGCTFPGSIGNSTATPTTYGIIKIVQQGSSKQIGSINFLEQKNYETGETNTDRGLSNLTNANLFVGAKKDEFYLVSQKQGVYFTENAGQLWRRIYVFTLDSKKATPEERTTERDAQLNKNNLLTINGFVLDPSDSNTIYVAGLLGNIGKIYKSTDKGVNFKEIYSEVNQDIAVNRVVVNPSNSFELYAILGADTLIKSTDQGNTWQKIHVFEDGGTILQFGYIPYLNNLFYIFQNSGGLSTSIDSGLKWNRIKMERQPNQTNASQPQDALSLTAGDSLQFGSFERLIPIKSKPGSFLMLADRQLWQTDNLNQSWKKINLPLQTEQNQISTLDVDPVVGLDKIYFTIQNKLFTSLNRGDSWSSETLPITVPVTKILVDPNDSNVIYICL
jgi:photosystem II stability/assembly factor-like uncharacterized protein